MTVVATVIEQCQTVREKGRKRGGGGEEGGEKGGEHSGTDESRRTDYSIHGISSLGRRHESPVGTLGPAGPGEPVTRHTA